MLGNKIVLLFYLSVNKLNLINVGNFKNSNTPQVEEKDKHTSGKNTALINNILRDPGETVSHDYLRSNLDF